MPEQDGAMQDTNALKAQLSAAVARLGAPSEEIRDLVCALVDKMKGEGAPPEKVVIAVKSAVAEGLEQKIMSRDPGQRQLAEKLVELAIGWCIPQYYGTS